MILQHLPELIQDFLKLDSYLSENIFYQKLSFVPLNKNSEVQNMAKQALTKQVIPYYSKLNLQANTSVYNFLVEPLKNANFHGPRDVNIEFELFLTPLVIAASYNDGGAYFKRQEVKEAWENRIKFPEKHDAGVYGIGFGVGNELIYDLADLIHVDVPRGILYTGWIAKNFCR